LSSWRAARCKIFQLRLCCWQNRVVTAAVVRVRPRLGRAAFLPALAVVPAIAVLLIARGSPLETTTYGAVSPAARSADLAAGLGLVAAGLAAWSQARIRAMGALSIAAGAVWLAPDWEGWAGGPSLVRSLGALAAPLLAALLLHTALAAPTGRLGTIAARATAGAGYLLAGGLSLAVALVRDPLFDLSCWRNCTDNAFLLHGNAALARTLVTTSLWALVAMCALLVAIAAARLLRTGTGACPPLLVPVAVAGIGQAAYAIALLAGSREDPHRAGFAALFFARSLALVALAGGVVWVVAGARRKRSAVMALARALGEAPAPGELRAALATALGDAQLELVYALPRDGRLVDAGGSAAPMPAPGDGRAVTPVLRDGERIALVVHDASLIDAATLQRELGAATRLAIDNERLQAELLAQLADLRASRARIVESGDSARQRLERDLHDGAQQRLLALSYDLRVARAQAQAAGARKLETLLDAAVGEAEAALTDLRDLAQGIFPMALAQAGLEAALESVCDTAPVAVTLHVTGERFAPGVETAAYVTVVEALERAAGRRATVAEVEIVREEDRLVVSVADDRPCDARVLVHAADRVGALGGTLVERSEGVRAEIPCG
jgi:signal transduction histidine kinase